MRFILAKTKMRIDIRKTQLILDFLENEVSWYCEDDLSKMDQKLPFSPLKSPNHAKINPIPPRRGGATLPPPLRFIFNNSQTVWGSLFKLRGFSQFSLADFLVYLVLTKLGPFWHHQGHFGQRSEKLSRKFRKKVGENYRL